MEGDLLLKAEESDFEHIPAALEEKPELTERQQLFRALFWQLSNRRPLVGGGMGAPMPRMLAIQDVYLAAPDWGIDPAEFLAVTSIADGLYIEHLAAQMARQAKRKPGN